MDPAPDRALARIAGEIDARPVPVLRASARALERLAAREASVSARELAQTVRRDPLLALGVLRYLATHRSSRMLEEIAGIEHAIMMIGVARFFAAFGAPAALEDHLAEQPRALARLAAGIRRARAASLYAEGLAALRADPAPEEVALAALLSDFAHLLLLARTPDGAVLPPEKRARLQELLARRWALPGLTLAIHDPAQSGRPRVRVVAAAAALALHAEQGWQDAELETGLAEIARLAGCATAEAAAQVFDLTLRVIEDREWYGAEPTPLPLPRLPQAGDAGAEPGGAERAAYELAFEWLGALASGRPLRGHPRGGLLRDARHDQLAAIAALMHGVTAGCGYDGALFLALAAGRWAVLYRSGKEFAPGREPPPPVAHAAQRALLAGGEDIGPGEPPPLFAMPLCYGGAPSAVLAVAAPRPAAAQLPDLRDRFLGLAAACETALVAIGAPPFWNNRTTA